MKYMEITIAEFRKNLKTYFEKALHDEVVCIDRGGVHYNLTARLPREVAPYGEPKSVDWSKAQEFPLQKNRSVKYDGVELNPKPMVIKTPTQAKRRTEDLKDYSPIEKSFSARKKK